MASRPPCRFYRSPGGCRQGTNCKFAHINPAATGEPPSAPGGSGHNRFGNATNSPNVPAGVCRAFWTRGTCARGAGCWFKHQASDSPKDSNLPTGHTSAVPHDVCRIFWSSGRCPRGDGCRFVHRADPAAPTSLNQPPATLKSHFEAAGLGTFPSLDNDQFSSGSGTNATPGETHHFLKKFLEDNFRFQTPTQVYNFLELLCNANTQNPIWTPEHGQIHLRNITKGNGVLRLGDVIRFPQELDAARQATWSFHRGYVPLLTYFSSEWVVRSTIHSDVNMLYGLIHTNFAEFSSTIQVHMTRFMQTRSFKEPGGKTLGGMQIFKVLFTTFFEYLTRFKDATVFNPSVCDLVHQIASWFQEWTDGLGPPTIFEDECSTYDLDLREFLIKNLSKNKDQVLRLVERGRTRLVGPPQKALLSGRRNFEALAANLQRIVDYDGPGELREKGPRHDNDYVMIKDIRIAPTHEELLCQEAPYLPPNFPGAPHFLESRNVERLLDIQFRLLREELIAPIRLAIQSIVLDLRNPSLKDTKLSNIIKAGGGRYPSPANLQDSVIFSVFTNITFEPLLLSNRGASVGVVFDAPPGKARSDQSAVRAAYWEQVAKKRLMQGGLVALIWRDHTGAIDVYIGTVASSPRDLVEASKKDEGRVSLRVSFFDTAAELRIVRALQSRRGDYGTLVLIEAPVFFEGIRPFLEALKMDPEFLPFSRYLCHQSSEELKNITVDPPSYSLTPRFTFELKDLFPADAGVQSLSLATTDPQSIARAKGELTRASRLDPSQAEAVVDSLTREICLIQGPPGTGKSYTGLEIIRVLLKNKVKPILLVAFTNHALDHMLKGVLDAGITEDIIRLGSWHSADERTVGFSLEKAERRYAGSLEWEIKAADRQMKGIEDEMETLMNKLAIREVPTKHFESCLFADYPQHYEALIQSPPLWIWSLFVQLAGDQEGWETVGRSQEDASILRFWLTGKDIDFLRPPQPQPARNRVRARGTAARGNKYSILSKDSRPKQDSDYKLIQRRGFVAHFLSQHGFNAVPAIPQTNRPLESLLKDPDVWNMSLSERASLYDTWYMSASKLIRQAQVEDFEKSKKKYDDALKRYQELKDQVRVNILEGADIVGCTTTGAAKVVSSLARMKHKVMVVEEAGQVLESHILASLVQSVEQIIMIGDPLQLRPNINSYKLSLDNRDTGEIYQFDQSLMERLFKSGFPMSQLDVQRRMRPTISSLIRNTLYPKLQDHQLVHNYPDVRGMHKNVYFVSHAHREAGKDEDTVSKRNDFEIDMIYDLVLHLLKQGCYNSAKNIVVLTAYLGQIPKIRKRLQDVVTTVVDERDSELLAQHGLEEDDTPTVRQVQASSRVLIRTLDNFQGEEGEIIILSLVRNNGKKFDGGVSSLEHQAGGRSRIGFLKSENRVNVGLSRAKHGLYIFGNAPQLAQGCEMWACVLKELYSHDSIGAAIPISCHQHPEYVRWIDQPGMLPIVSPDGGCLQPCGAPLSCGHRCPHKCHADDPNHFSTKCQEHCLKLCSFSHPCDRRCFECSSGCGNCRFPIKNILLPCGHTHPEAHCYLSRLPEKIQCLEIVNKQLPSCEHAAEMPCHQDPSSFECTERCGTDYSCCSKTCMASCGDCKDLNVTEGLVGPISRTVHVPHSCGRPLFCGHDCQDDCKKGHICSGTCEQNCRQVCPHGDCPELCSVACNPCIEKCAWQCEHARCPSTCSMACTRLPCDQQCPEVLSCGHPCPSVCGEPCEEQTCRSCAGTETLGSIVDLIMHTSLRDLKDDGFLDSMTVTLRCGHIFTVETLDGITHLNDFYDRDHDGNWIRAITPEAHGEGRTHPVCPTCQGDITALRYGRVCKISNLAIMQHNVSANLSRMLARSKATLEDAIIKLETSAADFINKRHFRVPASPEPISVAHNKLDILLRQAPKQPTPVVTLQRLDTYHAFPPSHSKAWNKAVRNLLEAYRQARAISENHDSTVKSYEASLSILFQEEMNHPNANPNHAPGDAENAALRLARTRIGQAPPRASLRFVVEAFWVTVRILIVLAETATQANQAILTREAVLARDVSSTNCTPWVELAEYFLKRAVNDSDVALAFAEQSESWNKSVKCQVIVMQARFELAAHRCHTAIKYGNLDSAGKCDLVELCAKGYEDANSLRMQVARQYMSYWDPKDRSSRAQWLKQNFFEPSAPILENWTALKQSAESGSWYSGVIKEGRRNIMRAMMEGQDRISHTGHFYECINGHPYVIGECGGAMQESRCPECGTLIRGYDHNVTAGNAHAREFVELAREEGAQASPWRWGPERD